MKAIILDYERGVRKLNPDESYSYSLFQNGNSAVEWNLKALDACGIKEIIFVCGYHIEKLIASYPQYKFYYLPNWQNASLHSALSLVESEIDEPVILFTGRVILGLMQ